MAELKKRQAVTGVRQYKYKTGTTGGGFGATAAAAEAQPSGACLTPTANGELGLAGLNDPITHFLDTVEGSIGKCRAYSVDAGQIADILTDGTLTPGKGIVGASDSDRGKAKNADVSGATLTAVNAKILMNKKWVVIEATAGKATVEPSP